MATGKHDMAPISCPPTSLDHAHITPTYFISSVGGSHLSHIHNLSLSSVYNASRIVKTLSYITFYDICVLVLIV